MRHRRSARPLQHVTVPIRDILPSVLCLFKVVKVNLNFSRKFSANVQKWVPYSQRYLVLGLVGLIGLG